jgi:hypothetical protein
MTLRRFLPATVLALLLAPGFARADRRELYTLIEVAPQFMQLEEPITGGPTASSVAGDGSLTVYYGLTNSLHLGGSVHLNLARDVEFTGADVQLQDGSQSTGTVFIDTTGISGTALIAYRFDLGRSFAPVAQVEVGLASLSYTNIAHVPESTNYGIAFADTSETALELRGSLRGEYRFGDHLIAGGGVGAIVHPGALNPWTLYVPITVGWIW